MNVPPHVLLGALLLTACAREPEATVEPPPLPQAPAPEAPSAEPEQPVPEAPAKAEPAREAPAKESKPAREAPAKEAPAKNTKTDKTERPPGWGAAYVPPTPTPAPKPAASVPVPVPAPTPAPAPAKPKTRVTIPRTEHVRVEVPSGLQADLDADPRMQPWVEKVIAIADSCHAKARGNTGTIEAAITMHENDRPDADVRGLPPQLGSLVACATGSLMRTKMPFFTGREGARYTVRIIFE